MIGGKYISEGYVGITMDVYNPDDNIDLYNLIKKDNPNNIILYGINKNLYVNDIDILKYLEGKTEFIVKKIKKGSIIVGSARLNFKNELSSIKKIFKFMGNKIEDYTTIKPIFKYNDVDIYALSYKKKFYIFQEKCSNTIDKIKFSQKEFNKMIHDIYEVLLLLQKNNFLHNDLKADNIIYCNNKYKLIDWDNAWYSRNSYKVIFKRGNFLFNHPYKFYNKGIPLFVYYFISYILKSLDNKQNQWLLKLKSLKIMEKKIANSANELIYKKPTNINKYYDNYSLALLIIYLAEKNNLTYSKIFVNNLLKPFLIKI